MDTYRSNCPINLALEVFGDKWSLMIVRDIMLANKKNFRQLLVSDEKIASNILSTRLAMLEEAGVLAKERDPLNKLKFIYSLTKKGLDLFPILVELSRWAVKHEPVDLVRYKKIVDIASRKKIPKVA
jgi:DNA-binding HxlR family transcriptional regulator